MNRNLKAGHVYLGDSLELLADVEPECADMVCTDPPYGVAFKSNMGEKGFQKEEIANDKFEDFEKMLPRMFRQFKNVLKPGGVAAIFGSGGRGVRGSHALREAGEQHLTFEDCLVWDRCDIGMGWKYRPQWESILLFYKGPKRNTWNGKANQSNILRFPRIIPQAGDHPTPKPKALMARLIEDNTNPGDLVIDPFCGHGPTLLAADELKRKWLGIEIEPNYHRVAHQSMTAETSQVKLC